MPPYQADSPQSVSFQMRLLGRPAALQHGQPLPLRTRKAFGLLAMLALEGRLGRAELAERLWTTLEQSAGLANLRREVFRLHATPVWSLLDITPDDIGFREAVPTDVLEFQTCLGAGRVEQALALYQGPLLEGLDLRGADGFEQWLSERRADLQEGFLRALSHRAQVLEADGDLRGALAAHLERLRADNLQEEVHFQVMRLHALLGEREAALRQFGQLEEVLAHEFGLTPLSETVVLAQQIRAFHTPEVPQAHSLSGQTPRLSPPLVGREDAWNRLVRSTTLFCLLVSEPGLGKTRLAQDFARSRSGSLLIQGLEAWSGTPLSPVADALRWTLTGPDRARLLTLDAVWLREAAWLVPDLDPGQASTMLATAAPPEGRDRFLEGLARALAVAAGPGGTVIFDDLHWCDASTVEVAVHLTRLAAAGAFRIVGTARPGELEVNPAAARMLESLERGGRLQRITLEPLSDLNVLAVVRALSGGMQAQLFAQRLHGATGGNPLYLLETLRSLFATGLLTASPQGWSTPYDEATGDYLELPIPPSVSEAVLRRTDLLGGTVRRLLDLASLAGDGFQLAWLAGGHALSEWEQALALERALSAHLVEPIGNHYRFSHDLVRRALDHAIGPERRALSHRTLAENLARQGGAPEQTAEHYERAGLPAVAAQYWISAAQAAARVFAHEEALDQYARALVGGLAHRDAVLVHLARAGLLAAATDHPAVTAELELAEALLVGPDDADLDVQIKLARAGLHNVLGQYSQTLLLTEHLLADPALPSHLGASVGHEQGSALLRLGRLDAAEACLHATLGQVSGDAHDLIGKLQSLLQACAMQRGLLPQAQLHNAAALQAFRTAGSRVGAVKALGGSGLLTGLLGDARGAVSVLTEALNEARELRDIGVQRVLLLNLFKFLLEVGDLDSAVARLEEGLALARDPQDPYLEGVFLNNLGTVHRLRGDLGAALTAVTGALALADRTGIAQHRIRRRLTLAENYLDLGDPAGAHVLLLAAQELSGPDGLGELHAWQVALLARFDLAKGAPGAALTRLEDLIKSGLPIGFDDRARAAWVMGLAELALGTPQQALGHSAAADLPLDPLLRGWWLSVRLLAGVTPNTPELDTVFSAEGLLASGQLLPLESLGLERALASHLAAIGQLNRAQAHLRAARGRVRLLAASLQDLPALQGSFLDLNRDLNLPG